MNLRAQTIALLKSINNLSGNKLTRTQDLGLLIELAELGQRIPILEELSFDAKFASRTFGIMQRIGPDGEGYDRLSAEFTQSLKNVQNCLARLLEGAPEHVRREFLSTYLSMTHESLQHLLALCYDLSCYKNWLIDHYRTREH
jgi:hypothetical protein